MDEMRWSIMGHKNSIPYMRKWTIEIRQRVNAIQSGHITEAARHIDERADQELRRWNK